MRSSFLAGIALVFGLGCLVAPAPRPDFVEPRWGGAPAPLPPEIAEVTHEVLRCPDRCSTEAFSVRRDGRATLTFLTGDRFDSTWAASVDSAGYHGLTTTLVAANWFWSGQGQDTWSPLATTALRTSASALGRRQVWVHEGRAGKLVRTRVPAAMATVDSIVRAFDWDRCFIDTCTPRGPAPPSPIE